MKNRWEQFARDEAEFYILTHLPPGYRPADGATPEEHFFASGQAHVERILAAAEPWSSGHETALEIGCGLGRLTLAMAPHFRRLHAVDVAPTMLARLADYCREREVDNVATFQPDERWEADAGFDLVYSYLVFQHIEDWLVIESYLQRLAAALKPDGCACLQFDSRPRNLVYRLKNVLPDPVLPRTWRRGIRRIRRSRDELLALFGRCGLEVVAEEGARGPKNLFVLRRSRPAPQTP